MKVENFGREGLRCVRARIGQGDNVFVNFDGRWEWYDHYKTGSSRGLERFVGYVTAPEHIAVLNLAFRTTRLGVPPSREEAEREAIIAKWFAPGLAENRADARMALPGEGMFTAVPAKRLPIRFLNKDC